jgi:hypothetical protein
MSEFCALENVWANGRQCSQCTQYSCEESLQLLFTYFEEYMEQRKGWSVNVAMFWNRAPCN